MKRGLILLSVLLFSPALFCQQTITIWEQRQSNIADRMIGAFEAGQRARYFEQQIKMLEAQRQALERQLKVAEQEAEQQRQGQARGTAPTQAQIDQIKKETELELELFTAKHPDWKKYEMVMVHYATKLEPKNISTEEYLECLYTLAKASTSPQP